MRKKKKNNIKKKIFISTLAVFLIITLFSGCLEEVEKSNIDISLDQIRLNLEDLNDGEYKEYDKAHVTKAYTAPNGTIFEGWKILEKYNVRYNRDDITFIIQTLGRLTSEDKAEEFIDYIKNKNLTYNFSIIDSEEIGEKSYLGKNYTTIFGEKTTLFFSVFKIKDIVVALLGSNISIEEVIDYSHIIEENIEEYIS